MLFGCYLWLTIHVKPSVTVAYNLLIYYELTTMVETIGSKHLFFVLELEK